MHALYENVAGIDVHQKMLAVCTIRGPIGKFEPQHEHSTFGTTTKSLRELADYLLEQGITHVFMESTSQYWCPVWNVLEDYGFYLVLANPQRIKGIPGRKTDQNDSEWIADLGRMGLIPKSYIPQKIFQDLRRLTRTRVKLIHSRSQHRSRIHNVLQQANIKLTTYLSNIYGKTGMELLNHLIAGEKITLEMVEHAMNHRGNRFKATAEQLLEAMDGSFSKIHLEEIDVHLNIIKTLDTEIMRLEQSIEALTSQYQEKMEKLVRIPGVSKVCAWTILAEIGDNVRAFSSDKKLAKWAGLAPGSYESAGVVKSSHITFGDVYLKTMMYHAGRTAAHSNSKRFSELYLRIKKRGSAQKAVIACAHKVLRMVYLVLSQDIIYQEI